MTPHGRRFFLTLWVIAISPASSQAKEAIELQKKSREEFRLPSSTKSRANLALSQVILEGLGFSPEIRKAEAKHSEATNRVSEQEARVLPKIDLDVTGQALKRAIEESNQSLNLKRTSETYNFAFQLNQPLYTGGALLSGIAKFRLEERISGQQLFSVKQSVSQQLILAYFRLNQAQRLAEAALENEQILKAYEQIVARHTGIGRARRIDRLQSAVNLTIAQSEVLRLNGIRRSASDHLRALMGQGASPEVLVVADILTIPRIAKTKLSEALDVAFKQNPELLAIDLEVRRQDYENDLNLAEDRPKLSLIGSWGYQANDRPSWFDETGNYYTIGLKLQVPIFSGFSSFAKRRAHADLLRQDQRQLEQERLKLREKLESAFVALEVEETRLKMAELAAKQGREALSIANSGYRQGIVSSQDVFNAQRTRYDSERLVIETQESYLEAVLNIRYLLGVNLVEAYATDL